MRRLMFGASVLCLAASVCLGQPTVLHVDPAITTPGNGLSWANAKKTLQDALEIVNNNSGDYEVRLAGGATSPMLYKPDEAVDFSLTPGDRDLFFEVRTGLTIRGGYDSSTGFHDPEYFVSVLSGDIGTPSVEADNSVQVVRSTDTSSGAIEFSSLIIEDSFPQTFLTTYGIDLAATVNATVIFSDVRIRRHGAGGVNVYASDINLVRTIIEHNEVQGGGVLTAYEGGPVFLQDCIVRNNEAEGSAVAGLDISTTGTVQVIHCLIGSNIGQMAGGMRIAQPESLLFLRSVIHDNSATGVPGDPPTPSWFGGLWLEGNTEDSVANMWYCYVSDNSSAGDAGGMHCRFFLQFFANNCAFKDNSAYTRGGAIWSLKNGLHLVNCTLTGNVVGEPDDGGGVYYSGFGFEPEPGCTISNSIIWGNYDFSGPNPINNAGDCSEAGYPDCLLIRNSDLDADVEDLAWACCPPASADNIDADPQFVPSISCDFTLGGHVVEILSLSSTSPCLDAGDNSLLLEDFLDLNNNSNIEEPKPYDLHYLCDNQSYWLPRIVNGTVDMGAYELGPQCAGADWDEDGTVTVSDIFAFLTDWFANETKAYCFGGTCGVPAIFAFLTAWFAGCA